MDRTSEECNLIDIGERGINIRITFLSCVMNIFIFLFSSLPIFICMSTLSSLGSQNQKFSFPSPPPRVYTGNFLFDLLLGKRQEASPPPLTPPFHVCIQATIIQLCQHHILAPTFSNIFQSYFKLNLHHYHFHLDLGQSTAFTDENTASDLITPNYMEKI